MSSRSLVSIEKIRNLEHDVSCGTRHAQLVRGNVLAEL